MSRYSDGETYRDEYRNGEYALSEIIGRRGCVFCYPKGSRMRSKEDHPRRAPWAYDVEWISTNEAKNDYFLKPADLAQLSVDLECGFGLGCSKSYRLDECQAKAFAIHGGEAGIQKKKEAREKRANNKRKRVQEGELACARLVVARLEGTPPSTPPNSNATTDGITTNQAPSTGVDRQKAAGTSCRPVDLHSLRKRLLRNALEKVDNSNSDERAWKYTARNITPAVFAALAGKPSDPQLQSFQPQYAESGTKMQYSESMSATTLFQATDDELCGKPFEWVEGYWGIDLHQEIKLTYKPASSSLTLAGTGYLAPTRAANVPVLSSNASPSCTMTLTDYDTNVEVTGEYFRD